MRRAQAAAHIHLSTISSLFSTLIVATPRACLQVKFVRAGGAALAGVEVQGFTMTGTCAQGGGERYNFDATKDPEDLDNQLFVNA